MKNSSPEEGHYLVAGTIPDFLVSVEVDGKPAPVYSVAEQQDRKIVCYIEAQEGKPFAVKTADLRTARPDDSHALRLYVDGAYCGGFVRNMCNNNDPYASAASSAQWRHNTFTGKQLIESIRLFLFAKLQTTDVDDEACSDENVVKNLGSIQLHYGRIENVRPRERLRKSHGDADQTCEVREPRVHEQSKKAQLSHQAKFGEARAFTYNKRATYDPIDTPDSPFQIYEFRYRSRQLLQLEGHLPSSPTPSPIPSPSRSPEPPAATSPSPAESSNTPRPENASVRRSTSAAVPSETRPQTSSGPDHIALLRAELESLRRQERIAVLQREIAALEASTSPGGSSTQPSSSSLSSSSRKIKAEPDENRTDIKRVKKEVGDSNFSPPSSTNRKGKGKTQNDVIVLSDSD